MSYSFQVKTGTKAEAKAAVEAAFDAVVAQQSIHKRDRDAALATANAMIDLLVDDPDLWVSVSVNGYVSWRTPVYDENSELQGASVSVSASLVKAT
jgi:hypothetical protein